MNPQTLRIRTHFFANLRYVTAFAITVLLLGAQAAFSAAITTVSFSTNGVVLTDFFFAPLSGGGSTVNHDGDVVQLGYHSSASVGSEFSGAWIPLTGEGSANTAYSTSTIGDDSSYAADGEFQVGGISSLAAQPWAEISRLRERLWPFDSSMEKRLRGR